MRRGAISRLGLLAALTACSADDEPAICQRDSPVQIVATDNLDLVVSTTPTATIVALTGKYAQDDVRMVAGPDCGAPSHDLVVGLEMVPARVHLDPADDDPTIFCERSTGNFFRLDPTGEIPPELVLPAFDCNYVIVTAYGPLLSPQAQLGRVLVPDFPDDTTAEHIPVFIGLEYMATGDDLVYMADFGEIHRLDLETHKDTAVVTGGFLYDASATHVLSRSTVDYAIKPMSLHDLATGENVFVGLSRAGIDSEIPADTPYRSTSLRSWHIDPTGHAVIHVPLLAAAPMEAVDLKGGPLPFPEWGTPILALDDGTYVIVDDGAVFTARPGDDETTTLDWQYGSRSRSVVVRDGALEVQMEQDLYRVPLDGGPRSLIALQVGVRREWLDEHHILTIFDDRLETIRIGANVRREFGLARDFVQVPGSGVYYNNVLSFEQPQNGVWFAPEHILRPQLQPCPNSYYCQ